LYKSAPNPRTRRSRIAGFSMVELAVSLTVLLILTAIAIPSLMRTFRTYQLNDAAARLSDILKFTRFEAVRRNSLEYCQFNNPSRPRLGHLGDFIQHQHKPSCHGEANSDNRICDAPARRWSAESGGHRHSLGCKCEYAKR